MEDGPQLDYSRFFKGKRIFLTGATGFLGKVLLEKILRDLPQVDKLYLFVRACPTKNISPTHRLKRDILGSRAFDLLRSRHPNFDIIFANKVVLIQGDLGSDNLGLSANDMTLLLETTDVIIHTAAASDFGEPLADALKLNVLGTLQLLQIAKQMKHLALFLHVSSAYVNSFKVGRHVKVDEKLYPLGFDADDLVHTLTTLKPKQLEKMSSQLLKTFPNSHSLTKALLEHLLTTNKENVPVAIVRPSTIGATLREPFPGWVDSLSIAGTLFIYTGLGVVKFFPGDPNLIADIVPCDLVANLLLAAVVHFGSDPSRLQKAQDIPVVHAATSSANPVKWGYASQTAARYWQKNPPRKGQSPSSVYMVTNYLNYRSQFAMKYEAPAYFYSAMSKLLKSDFHKKQAVKLQTMVDKAHKINRNLKHFVENEWTFDTVNAELLREVVPDEERSKFDFDWYEIDWHSYLNFYCYGLQRFILKEEVPEPKVGDLKFGRMLSVDLEGRDRRLFTDVEFALRSSRHVKHPSLFQLRQIRKDVLASPLVTAAIKQVSEQKSIPEEVMKKKAKEIMVRMQTKLQIPWLRTLGWAFRKLWRSIYQQLEVNEQVLLKMNDALKKGPVLLIPSHRSYIDFLILSYVLFAFNLPVPLIAAGEDFLNLSFVSNVLRFAGAFFLRRTFRGDALYHAIFTEYVQRLLMTGCPMEFFVEGTRSRSGKLLQPKLGLVGIVTDVFYDKRVEDITFFPININYEKVIEDEAYTREWLGDPKKKENLENLIKASRILQHDFGRISIKFSQPISLKEYNLAQTEMVQKKNPNFDPFTNEEDKKAVDIALAHQIVYDINQASVWAPMAVVSAILLTYRLGIFRTQLVEKVDWLRQEIMRRQEGHEDWMAELSAAELTKQALARLENYVEDRKDMISSQEKTGVLVLAFNRNRLIHLFVRDSFIMVALAALGGDQPESKGVLLSELYKGAHFLVKLLGKEFVYKVHPNDDEGLERVVQDAIEQKVLELDSTNGADTIRLVQSETARSAFHFYAGLMWPFVECYWVASLVLYSLKPSATQMQPLVQRMQWMAEALISEGKMSFYESCSVETLKNAIHSLAKFGVMRFDNFGQVVGVNKSFLEDGAGSLRAFVADLGRYRRKVDDDVPTDIGVPRALLEDFPIRAKL